MSATDTRVIGVRLPRDGNCGLTFEFTGLRGFSRRSGGMRGWPQHTTASDEDSAGPHVPPRSLLFATCPSTFRLRQPACHNRRHIHRLDELVKPTIKVL